jgi:hypothetical protein
MRRAPFAPAAALALASFFAPPAAAQDDAALAWARAEVKRAPPPADVESLYWPARGAPVVLRPCRAACKRSWHLAAGPLSPEELSKRPVYKITPVPARAGVAAPPAAAAPPDRPPLLTLDELVRDYPTAAPVPGGVAQSLGASELAADALQAVGQVVVGRASRAALELVRDKIAEGLRCTAGADAGGPTRFPRTCAVVGALRLQDLEQRGHVLLDALFRDALEQALSGTPAEAQAALEPLMLTLVPEVSRLLGGHAGRGAEVVAHRIIESAMTDLKRVGARQRLVLTSGGTSRGWSAVALAALAHAQCAARAGTHGALLSLSHCPVDDYVRGAAAEAGLDDAAVLTRGHELARLLLDAMTLQQNDAAAFRERAGSAASAAFVATCLGIDASAELKGCPPSHELGPSPSALGRLALARFLTNAAIDGDPNALVVAAVAASRDRADRRTKRALRLLGGLLQYTATYDDRGPGGHERRVRLLEDLSDEMSSREERAGDAVWSLGGSLRVGGGARFGVDSKSMAFYGPLSLPLGVGLQTVPERGFGLHVEVSAFDLGQYLSFEEGGRVRKPELADALAPSLMVGAALGKSMPVIVGATVGYSPQFAFSDKQRGAINVGLALGLYVPLLDLNLTTRSWFRKVHASDMCAPCRRDTAKA